MSNLIAAVCAYQAVMGEGWWWAGMAAFFYWPVTWFLRWFAKHDPQFLAKAWAAQKQPYVREPHL